MTPAQLDHLSRLKRHLGTLLANAEKRTPGEWSVFGQVGCTWVHAQHDVLNPERIPQKELCLMRQHEDDQASYDNATFIASCAGNAEAGWKSTLAAIAVLIDCNPTGHTGSPSSQFLDSILTAWPIENLP